MSMVVRAADAPEGSREDYWRHAVAETLGPLELRMPPDVGDRLLIGDAGAVRVAELTAGRPGGASRSRRHIRRLDLEVCKIDVLARGRGVVTQDGPEASLGPGDFSFVDLSSAAHWAMSAMRMVAVVFPRALLPLRPDEVAGLAAVRFPGDRGTGALVSSLARQLVRSLDDGGTATGPGSAAPCSTWSPWPWGAGGGGRAMCRRRRGSGPCCGASTPSSRPGSATPP
jgi:hypothetical protein